MSGKIFSLFLTAAITLAACGTFEVSINQIQTPTAPAAADSTKIALEIEAASPQATRESILMPQSSAQPAIVEDPHGLSIALDKAVELQDGYILLGGLHWTDPSLGDYGVLLNEYVSLVDASGNMVAFVGVEDPAYLPTAPGNQSVPLAFKVAGKNHAWPITLSVRPTVTLPVDVSFPIDLGPNPQPGQSWDVGRDLPVGEHHTIRVVSASLAKHEGYHQFTFVMRSDTIFGASVQDKDRPTAVSGGCGSAYGNGDPREFAVYLSYEGFLPSGKLTLAITSVHILLDFPLQATWRP
jgi:hypothetical protein